MSQPQRGLTEETIVYLDDKIKTGKDWPSFSVGDFITAFPQYRDTLEKHKGGPLACLKEKYKHILNVRKQKAAPTTSSLATPSGNTSGNWHKQPILQGSDRGLQTGNLYMSGSQAPHVGGWSSGPPHTHNLNHVSVFLITITLRLSCLPLGKPQPTYSRTLCGEKGSILGLNK